MSDIRSFFEKTAQNKKSSGKITSGNSDSLPVEKNDAEMFGNIPQPNQNNPVSDTSIEHVIALIGTHNPVLDTSTGHVMALIGQRWISVIDNKSASTREAIESCKDRKKRQRLRNKLYLEELKATIKALLKERDDLARATGLTNSTTEPAAEAEAATEMELSEEATPPPRVLDTSTEHVMALIGQRWISVIDTIVTCTTPVEGESPGETSKRNRLRTKLYLEELKATITALLKERDQNNEDNSDDLVIVASDVAEEIFDTPVFKTLSTTDNSTRTIRCSPDGDRKQKH